MSIYKVTFFFESHQNATIGVGSSLGWTESWYKESSDSIQSIISSAGIDHYIAKRLPILDPIYRLSFVRVSDADNPRSFKLKNISFGAGTAFTLVDGLPGQVQCGVLADLERVPVPPEQLVHHRRFILRGIPSALVNGNVIQEQSKNFPSMLKFFDFVSGHLTGRAKTDGVGTFDWGLRWDTSTKAGTQILKAKVDVSSFGRHLLVQPLITGVPVGKLVQVASVPNPAQDANRFWRYLGDVTINAVTWSRLGTTRKPIDVDYEGPGTGKYRVPSYASGLFDQYAVVGLRSKKTGRAFRQLRGRR